jgi:general stress protein 26
MTAPAPVTTLGADFSSPDAIPIPWESAVPLLEEAQVYWLSTVRPDSRPHVTPLIGLWFDDAFHFCTGESERKAKNLAQNPHVVVTTGVNRIDEGLDIVLEGATERLTDAATLQQIADRYVDKYDSWRFTVGDGVLIGEPGNEALVFRVTPETVFGFAKGEPFSQTRWQF